MVRNWRLLGGERHTREVRAEHLPEEIRQALLAMATRVEALEKALLEAAQQIANANIRAVQVEQRLAVVEAAMHALAAEAGKRLEAAA